MSVPLYVPPSVPLRTKRNFKGLQLDTPPIPELPPSSSQAPPQTSSKGDPLPSRPAPAPLPLPASRAPGPLKKRPPPLGAEVPDLPPFVPPTDILETPISARRSAITASLSTTLAKLDMSAPVKFDLRDGDLSKLEELGQGNGGSVVKVLHVPSQTVMAKKIVLIDAKSSIRKQILRELQIMHDCKSEYIISSYGSYLAEPNICICMEFMDKGSFDSIYKRVGKIPIEVVGKVALAVLEGLRYLYDVHRIIHRDIKPSNILCNSEGKIKLCDFGVSGELINSIANTFVGTSVYMSPERIQGAQYSVKSDIWSLGITLIELAAGRFPFSDWSDDDDRSDLESLPEDEEDSPPAHEDDEHPGEEPFSGGSNGSSGSKDRTPTYRNMTFSSPVKTTSSPLTRQANSPLTRSKRSSVASIASTASRRRSKGVSLHGGSMTMSIIELMHQIVREPAPRLPEGFGKEKEAFVDCCLVKELEGRGTPGVLLTYEWMQHARESTFDLKAWTSTF